METAEKTNLRPPDLTQLDALACERFGDPMQHGWAVRQNYRAKYFLPAYHYIATVDQLVGPSTQWLDIGCGKSVFPHNAKKARQLSERCDLLVGVDPSDNIQQNDIVHEKAQCLIEDFETQHTFDLLTMRMVAEHISQPQSLLECLQRLVRPGGYVVIFTVNLYAPVTVFSSLVPDSLHHRVKQFVWKTSEEDTFPTAYKMNTRRKLDQLFSDFGFEESMFLYLDDLAVFGRFRVLSKLELLAWKACRAVRMTYPENCLLGVYRRT